ncbi:MAG: peptidase U32 family protein [Rectinemataceae bacterium]|nr:peptidase U32 family protein [Rectinemataceae bacterium]
MELLSPAGSIEKLKYAYRYGADAAYIGLPEFSLRAQAENIDDEDESAPEKIQAIKESFGRQGKPKKLYCTANIFFHDDDCAALERALPRIGQYPFDGFLVSDLGAFEILRKAFPDREFHLSTQANCTNWRAAKAYHDMGFSRIVPARELSLESIKSIKDRVPGLEVEAFVHGAMCMAYSGRCFISSWMTGRSANRGDCTHSCRWHYKLYLEEEKRPGQLLPVETGETSHGGYTLLMSSRDLCMIDHLADLEAAGVDSIKLEGRMKSLYYVALVTRAYRWALDHPGEANPFRADLDAISHREYDTGFFFDRKGMDTSAVQSYEQTQLFAGSLETTPPLTDSLGAPVDIDELFSRFDDGQWTKPVYVELKNTIPEGVGIELIAPEMGAIGLGADDYRFFDTEGLSEQKKRQGKAWFFQARRESLKGLEPQPWWLLRMSQTRP